MIGRCARTDDLSAGYKGLRVACFVGSLHGGEERRDPDPSARGCGAAPTSLRAEAWLAGPSAAGHTCPCVAAGTARAPDCLTAHPARLAPALDQAEVDSAVHTRTPAAA